MKKTALAFIFIAVLVVANAAIGAIVVLEQGFAISSEIEWPSSITIEMTKETVLPHLNLNPGRGWDNGDFLFIRIRGAADMDLSRVFPILIQKEDFMSSYGSYEDDQGQHLLEAFVDHQLRLTRFNKKGDIWESEARYLDVCSLDRGTRLALGIDGTSLRIVFPDQSPVITLKGGIKELLPPFSIWVCPD